MKSLTFRYVYTLAAVVLVGLLSMPTAFAAKPAARPAANGNANRIDYLLNHYELLTLDPVEVARQVRSTGRFTLTTSRGTFEIALSLHDMRSKDYRAEERLENGGRRRLERTAARTFAGTVVNVEGATARFTIDQHELTGLILAGDEKYFLESLGNYSLSGGPTDFVFYAASDVNPDAIVGECAATEAERVATAAAATEPQAEAATAANRVVDLATDADNEYVSALGSATAANNEILSIMNQVEGVYQNEVGLAFNIVFQNTYAGADPYSAATDPSTMLSELRTQWNANMTSVSRDLVHMWTGRDMDSTTIGIAYTDVVCNNSSYSYGISQRYTSAPQKYILTAHEIGHNFGACHSDTSCNPNVSSCPNTIMASAVGTGLTFCQFSRDQIVAHVSASSGCIPTLPLTTIGLYNPTTGTFFLKNTNAGGGADITVSYGPPGATPLSGDWDGNATSTLGVYTPANGAFFLKNSNTGGSADLSFTYGPIGAIPIVGDWDGNKTVTVGVYVPASSTFFLKNANAGGNADYTFQFGPAGSGWLPIVGDWNGDGKDTIGLYNPATGTFFLKNTNASGAADLTFSYGPAGAKPVAGDWAGLGRDTVGIYVEATSTYFLKNTNAPGNADATIQFGAPLVTGIVGDWDGR